VSDVTEHDVKYTGFVRTVSFQKAIGMFPPGDITRLVLERGVQTMRVHEKYPTKPGKVPYFFRDEITVAYYRWEWDAKVHGGLCPVDTVQKVIGKVNCGDYVIKELSVVIRSDALVDYYNGLLELKSNGKKPVLLRPGCEFHALFKGNPSEELQKLDFIREMNHKELNEYGFKLSSLDLVALNTERAKKYGEREFLSVNEDPKVIRAILKALDWSGWPDEQRVVDKDGVKSYPKPAAVRQYTFGGTEGWILSGQQEVD